MAKPTVDIILPCFNPPARWAQTVVNAYNLILEEAVNFVPRLIIVNDGSKKGVQGTDVTYIDDNIEYFTWLSYPENKGKGFALRYGVEKSFGDFIVLTDIDFPYKHESVMSIINEIINSERTVLAGERSENYYSKTPTSRKIVSKALKGVIKFLLQLDVDDTQCGLKAMTTSAKQDFLKTTIDRYLYDIEFLWMAGKNNTVRAHHVQLKDDVVFTKLNVKILLVEGWNFLKIFMKTIF